MKNRRFVNLLVIGLVGLLMPAYYKIKYLILGVISWTDILNWLSLLEVFFSTLLAGVVVFGHDRVATFLRQAMGQRGFIKRFLIQYGISTIYSVVAAIAFSYLFWTYIVPMGITGEFLFDYAVLGLLIPLLVNGLSESLYFYGQWEAESFEKAILEKENVKAKYEVLQSQLSPHFLFNCFNTLAVLIDESRSTALKFLQQLSKVYRYVLEIKDHELVTLKAEWDALRSYAELMKHRFGQGFEIQLKCEKETEQFLVVPLTLQTLLENALKHNTFSNTNPLMFDVAATDQNLTVSSSYRPNGNRTGTGIGLRSLQKRYQAVENRSIDIRNDLSHFIVEIPLIKPEES